MSDRIIRVSKNLPTASDVHVDRLLTDFSVGAIQDTSVGLASSIFPLVSVTNQSNKYRIWDKADFFRNEARKRAPGTPVPRGGFRMSTDSYYCDVYDWGTQLDEETIGNADNPAEVENASVMYVMQILGLRREIDFMNTFMTTSVWGKDYAGVASGANGTTTVLGWNISGSTPIEDMQKARRRVKLMTGQRANTIVLGYDVRDVLDTHAQIIARLVNGQTPGQAAEVTDADLARLFKVSRVITADAVYNAAAEGLTVDMNFIAGDFVWVGYVDPNPGLVNITAGVTFAWNGMRLGSGLGTRIERRYDDEIKAWKIDGFANWDQKKTSADSGVFFSNMIS